MIIIEYDPDKGEAIQDGKADFIANNIANGDFPRSPGWKFDQERYPGLPLARYATENIFDAIRVLVKKGRIKPDAIQFKFKDQIITIDKDGRCPNWPEGFCDYSTHWLMQLF